ncbi:unnamed protein product [Lactuca saligna]|uniref:Protein kinase domain-containing protein n=1 Tax=Lactuca saligna TaxID=75948 RepID=A0AA35VCQ2_LACSI|nr:unnamed protein product [Lactuca saligna]
MSSSGLNLENYRIPLEEINRATNDFGAETLVGDGGFGMVHKAQLGDQTVAIKRLNRNNYQGNDEFRNELHMVSSFKHPNIIPFIGYCDDKNEMIIVYEYAMNTSLDRHLQNPEKRRLITWAQRLKICLGAARGLKYLHSGLGHKHRVIHRDVKSANILLDDNMEAKICDFGLSRFGPRNQVETHVITKASGTRFYIDPLYNERGRLAKESDIYSFGVVLFEISSGMLAYQPRFFGDANEQYLLDLVRSHYDDQELVDGVNKLIDPDIRGDIDMRSFHTFNKIAHQCISFKLKERPSMDRIIGSIEEALNIQNNKAASTVTIRSIQPQNLESFRIPLKEIKLATGDFSPDSRIKGDGIVAVFKGHLSQSWQNRKVAIKRLDPKEYEGENQFHNQLKLVSSFHHENIIHFIGYCDEGNEMIIVYEYASNHSLDHHFKDLNKRRSLTWAQRLKICLGTAKGLKYLHSGRGNDHRVIHGNIRSRKILLDQNLEAKICDFGMFQQGTNLYLDPVYHESGILDENSDVYSFGVVLFEMLTGMLVDKLSRFGDSTNPQPLISLVQSDGLEKIIDSTIRYQIDDRSLQVYKELAYKCISNNSKERPTVDTVIKMIEDAIHFQY